MEIKSELVMCPRGHYYNAAVHASCPICSGSVGPVGGMGGFPSTEPLSGAGGGMGGFSSTEAPGGMGGGVGGFSATEAPGGMGGAMGGFSSTEAPGGMGGGVGGFSATEAPGAVPGGGWGGGSIGPTMAVTDSAGPINPFSVQTTIGGDVVGPRGARPVVGWLVCIDGPSRGTEWRIHAGYNYIGREVGDIHIQGDTQISREKHALVAYYAKTRSFFVGPAEGRNIVELNEEPVFNTMALKNYDIITIGATRLMFVGLCGDHFSWSEVADNA